MVRNNPFNIQLPGLSENRVPQDLMDYQFIQLAAIFFIQVYGCLSIPTTSRVFCMGQPQVGPGKRGQLSQPKIIQVVDCWGNPWWNGVPPFEYVLNVLRNPRSCSNLKIGTDRKGESLNRVPKPWTFTHSQVGLSQLTPKKTSVVAPCWSSTV